MNPYLVERLQPFGTTIFAEMSALAVETGAINLGQGFPDTDGPDVVKQAAIDAIRGRAQPVPARHRHPRAARRDPRAPAALLRARLRRRHRGARHRGRDRGDRGRAARAVRSGRRGRDVRAVLRLVRGVHRDGRRDAPRRHAAHPRLRASTPTSCGPRSRRARSSSCSTRRTTRRARCSTAPSSTLDRRARAGTRPARRHRRGLRASRLRRRARPARDAARHARPHGHDQLRRQDVLVHRLEGRLGVRDARARRPR